MKKPKNAPLPLPYLDAIIQEADAIEEISKTGQRHKHEGYLKLQQKTTAFYLYHTLKNLGSDLAIRRFINESQFPHSKADILSYEPDLQLLQQEPYLSDPVLQAYYQYYSLLKSKDKNDLINYQELITIFNYIKAHRLDMDVKVYKELLLMLSAVSARSYNMGLPGLDRFTFLVHNEHLNLLEDDEYIDIISYRNIVALCVAIKDEDSLFKNFHTKLVTNRTSYKQDRLSWMNGFIDAYAPRIQNPELRMLMHDYCMAVLQLAKGNYEKSIAFCEQKKSIKDVVFAFIIKFLHAKSIVAGLLDGPKAHKDADSITELYKVIDAMDKQIKRDENKPKYDQQFIAFKKVYLGLKPIHHIFFTLIKSKDKNDLAASLNTLQQAIPGLENAHKQWFEEQFPKLKALVDAK